MSFDGGYDGNQTGALSQVSALVGGVGGTIWWRHGTFCSRQIRESFVAHTRDAPPAVGTLAWAPVTRGDERTLLFNKYPRKLKWGRKHPVCEGFQLAIVALLSPGKGGGPPSNFAYYIPDPEVLLHILRQNRNPNVIQMNKKVS